MRNLIFNGMVLCGALLIISACSRQEREQDEIARTRVVKKEVAASLLKQTEPADGASWEIPVRAGQEYLSYVRYTNEGGTATSDSVAAVILDDSRHEYEIFELGGQVDSMLGHRILSMPVEDKKITLYVANWPGNAADCVTERPTHHMEGGSHFVTFQQTCSMRDSSGLISPGPKRRVEFRITVR